MPLKLSAEPWLSFLNELDQQLEEPTDLHCMGGFVATQAYGTPRATADIDILSAVPVDGGHRVLDIAGGGTPLCHKYRMYVERVAIATVPENYESRLAPLYPGAWRHLRLFALEAHDLALSKLERNCERDQGDVEYLARAGFINAATLKQRYEVEMRDYVVGRLSWHDQTLQLWIDEFLPGK